MNKQLKLPLQNLKDLFKSVENNWPADSSLLVWPQWWSFADVSQHGLHFSKKINKMKIFFWFDFHRCLHGPSKIGHHFRKQSGSKIEVFKNDINKKTSSKFNEKNSLERFQWFLT